MSIPQPYDTGLTEEQIAEAFRRALGDMTDEEIEKAIATAISLIPKGLVYRGAYNYFSELPTNAKEGEVYTVKYKGDTSGTEPDGNEYAWGKYEGTLQWIPLGVDSYTKKEIDEQRSSIESDISLLEENKLNFAYFVAQNTTTTAGWYEVAKCDVIPSGGGNVRDITLCIQLTNANNTVGAKWAILNVATVISKNSTTQSTIDTMAVSFIVNKGFNTSDDNPDIIVVGTTDGTTVKLAIWCKLQVQYAYCRGIPLIDAARVSLKQFNTPNYWQLLNMTTKYDSYPTDWERKIIPTDYYGGQLKSLSDRITALENK